MNIPSEIHRITFDQTTNRYKLIFKQIGNLEKCVINIVSSDAKNIALSKENISSSRLKTYNLILNLLTKLSFKIDKTIITKNGKNIISNLYLIGPNENISINCNFVDSIILVLKSFSIIYLHQSFYQNSDNNFTDIKDETVIKLNINQYMSNRSKINRLKKTLKELIQNENYETAAVVRDRIFKISNNKKINN